jgi:hypothetical protein
MTTSVITSHPLVPKELKSLFPVGGHEGRKPLLLQEEPDALPNGRIIFDNQDHFFVHKLFCGILEPWNVAVPFEHSSMPVFYSVLGSMGIRILKVEPLLTSLLTEISP